MLNHKRTELHGSTIANGRGICHEMDSGWKLGNSMPTIPLETVS